MVKEATNGTVTWKPVVLAMLGAAGTVAAALVTLGASSQANQDVAISNNGKDIATNSAEVRTIGDQFKDFRFEQRSQGAIVDKKLDEIKDLVRPPSHGGAGGS